MSKVSIIGAGAVGSTAAYLLSETPWVKEVVLVDVDRDRAQGQALDMMHGVGVSQAKRVIAGEYEATQGSDVIIITIGVPEKSRGVSPDSTAEKCRYFKRNCAENDSV